MPKILLALLISLTLIGCQSAAHFNQMRTSETSAYSCQQIYATFRAYEADRQSATLAAELSGMFGLNKYDPNSTEYYARIKMAANVALLAQGCQAL